jgi:hypothetical protein
MVDKRIAGGLALIAAAFAVMVLDNQARMSPRALPIVLVYGLLLAGCVLVVQGWRARYGRGGPPPLTPGESYDRPVRLAVVDNVPLAELWRQRLHDEGVEAAVDGTLLGSPGMPVALLVGEHDLDRARQLFPELQLPS